MDASCYFPKVIKLLSWFQHNVGIVRIRRYQSNLPAIPHYPFPVPHSPFPIPQAKRLHRKVAIDTGDDDVATGGAKRTVDDKEVSIADSIADHGIALHLNEERGCWSLDQQLVQVKRRFLILLGGRGKPCDNRAGHLCVLAHAYTRLYLSFGCLQRGQTQSAGRSSNATPSCSAGS